MSFFRLDAAALQNSALCSLLLWRFCVGYEQISSENKRTPLHLLFIVLPINLNPISRNILNSTQVNRGLLAFAAKFSAPPLSIAKKKIEGIEIKQGRENLIALNGRMISFRPLTMRSLAVGVSSRLLEMDINGSIKVLSLEAAPSSENSEVREMLRASEKLGKMCASHSIAEVARILGVAF